MEGNEKKAIHLSMSLQRMAGEHKHNFLVDVEIEKGQTLIECCQTLHIIATGEAGMLNLLDVIRKMFMGVEDATKNDYIYRTEASTFLSIKKWTKFKPIKGMKLSQRSNE